MPRYKVNHRYASGPVHDRIAFEAGHETELSEEDAARINADSPGTLTAVVPEPEPEPEPEEVPGEAPKRRQSKPAPNRQQRGGANRGA